jgi:hypothetical protein
MGCYERHGYTTIKTLAALHSHLYLFATWWKQIFNGVMVIATMAIINQWYNLADVSNLPYSNATTNTLTITSVTNGMGFKYRVQLNKIGNSCGLNSVKPR